MMEDLWTYFKIWIGLFVERTDDEKIASVGVYHFSQCRIPKINNKT